MIANLGVGIKPPPPAGENEQQQQQLDGETAPDGNQDVAMQDSGGGGGGGEEEDGEEEMEERSVEETARVVLDLLIEVREERFTEEDISEIILITQECLGGKEQEVDVDVMES